MDANNYIEPQNIVNVKCVNKRCAAICHDPRFKTLYKEKWERYVLWKKIKDGGIYASASDVRSNRRVRTLRNITNNTLSHSTSPEDWKRRMVAAFRKNAAHFTIAYFSGLGVIEVREGANRFWILSKYDVSYIERATRMEFTYYSIFQNLATLL